MALKIPPEDRSSLAKLGQMPEGSFRGLLVALDRSPDTAPAVKGLSADEIEQLWDTIKTMHRVRQRHDLEIEEFAEDISKHLLDHKDISESNQQNLKKRLGKAFNLEALSAAAKAETLGIEHEHVFCTARIFTDLRPVFSDDISSPPGTMVISHQLKIAYHKAPRGLHEIYVALSSEDIKDLRILLDRAERKVESLKSSLAASKLKFIDPQHT